jgi:hypothetical protein
VSDSTLGAVTVACLFGILLIASLITRSMYLPYIGRLDRNEEPPLYWAMVALYGIVVVAALYGAVYGPIG